MHCVLLQVPFAAQLRVQHSPAPVHCAPAWPQVVAMQMVPLHMPEQHVAPVAQD